MDKAEVLAKLYNNARAQGVGVFVALGNPGKMTVEEARELLKEQTYFDYLKGRVMKVKLDGDELRTDLYNRDNGPGAAEFAITGEWPE
jgi:hypothetical protein